MSDQNNDDVRIYNQPPGWAVKEAQDQLGQDAAEQDVLRLAWEYVDRDDPKGDDS